MRKGFLGAVSRLIPLAVGLRLGPHFAASSAWLIRNVARSYVPDHLRQYPARVGDLLGEALPPSEARRLMRERLSFRIARRLASHALATPRGRRSLLEHLEVNGLEHLHAAQARGHGVVLVTTHFGFPYLMRIVLLDQGICQLHAHPRDDAEGTNVAVSGGPWQRLAALQRFRSALADGAACVLLADGRMGAPIRVPLFSGETTIAFGSFYLGYLAQCPIVPFFTVMSHRSSLRVEIAPALTPPTGSSPAALAEVAEEFLAIYGTYVRRYPSHLPRHLFR